MKKRTNLIVLSHEQERKEPWQWFAQQQQQAKTGTVTSDESDNPTAVQAALAAADPLRSTAGALQVLSLKAIDGENVGLTLLTNNLAVRTVLTLEGSGNEGIVEAVDQAAAMTKSAELTFDGAEINNAPLTNTVADGTGLATPINAAIAAQKPSYSLQSIINKLEDIILLDGTKDAVVIVDQVTEKIYVYTGTPTNAANALIAGQSAGSTVGSFDIDSTPLATSVGEFGE